MEKTVFVVFAQTIKPMLHSDTPNFVHCCLSSLSFHCELFAFCGNCCLWPRPSRQGWNNGSAFDIAMMETSMFTSA